MLERIDELVEKRGTFAIETTLATRSYAKLVEEVQGKGYVVILLYFWLKNVELAKDRVESRVKLGGHNIPEDVIERRYSIGVKNLKTIFIGLVDEWIVFDNSYNKQELIAEGSLGKEAIIRNDYLWNTIQQI
jgi:predicted ABC-type ATPase